MKDENTNENTIDVTGWGCGHACACAGSMGCGVTNPVTLIETTHGCGVQYSVYHSWCTCGYGDGFTPGDGFGYTWKCGRG